MKSLLSVTSGTQRTKHYPKATYQTGDSSNLGWSNFNIDLAEMASPHYWAVTFRAHNCCTISRRRRNCRSRYCHMLRELRRSDGSTSGQQSSLLTKQVTYSATGLFKSEGASWVPPRLDVSRFLLRHIKSQILLRKRLSSLRKQHCRCQTP